MLLDDANAANQMRHTENERLWCFSFIQQLFSKYFRCQTMQSSKHYKSLNENNIALSVRRLSLEGNSQSRHQSLQKSKTMFSSFTEGDYTSDKLCPSSTSAVVINPNITESVQSNHSSTSQILTCPQCSIKLQLPSAQNTPEIHQYNRQSSGIRTNPWISYSRLEVKNNKPTNTMLFPYSISSSPTDSGIYICTDSGSRCENITRSTTENEIDKSCCPVNTTPIIPISPDPPPSPAPSYTENMFTSEYLSRDDTPFDINEYNCPIRYSKTNPTYICKSATFDLSNLTSNTNEYNCKPRRRLLTRRVRNHIRNSWLHTNTGSTTKVCASPMLHLMSSSSSSSHSSEHEVNDNGDQRITRSNSRNTLTPDEQNKKPNVNLHTFDLLYMNPDSLLSKDIDDSEDHTAQLTLHSQAILNSLIESMEPNSHITYSLSNTFNPFIGSIQEGDLDDTLYEDIQLENLRTSLKILLEAKNVINMQMRNLSQNYINYLKSKYSATTNGSQYMHSLNNDRKVT
ncbi:unnamed protein product [Trichobilharzia szidati]|nr:unnamed protein product [Trichobilharzia szidati]